MWVGVGEVVMCDRGLVSLRWVILQVQCEVLLSELTLQDHPSGLLVMAFADMMLNDVQLETRDFQKEVDAKVAAQAEAAAQRTQAATHKVKKPGDEDEEETETEEGDDDGGGGAGAGGGNYNDDETNFSSLGDGGVDVGVSL